MKRLLVTADDFGLCSGINRGVAAALRGGVVSRASIVPTGQAFDEAVELAKAIPGCGIGIHLVLTEEKPLCEPSRIPSLVGPDGRFLKTYRSLCLRYAAGRIDPVDLERELRSQTERVVAAGLRPEHLDSHCHVGVLPACFELMVRLAQEFRIPYLRLPLRPLALEPWEGPSRPGAALRILALCGAGLMARRLKGRLHQAGLRCADRVAGLRHSGALDKHRLLSILRRLPPGVTELICHPGIADLETWQRYGHWGYDWETELRALADPAVRESLAAEGIQLIGRLPGP